VVKRGQIEEDEEYDHNGLNTSFEKKIMGTASAYKYTKDNKIYLPTLIKAIEVNKVSQLMNKKHTMEVSLKKMRKQNEILATQMVD